MFFAVLVLITFFLHLAWERVHIRLYTQYDGLKGSASWRMPVPVWAALGDVLYTLFAVMLVAFFKGDILWFQTATAVDYFLLAGIGFCTALFVEYKAFYFKRWEYTSAMPIIPGLRVGLSSVVQKSLLFPLSVWLANIVIAIR